MTFNVRLPDEFGNFYDPDEFEARTKLVYALDLYLSGKVSIMKASELSQLTLEQFKSELQLRGIRRKTGLESVDQIEAEMKEFEQFIK